MPQDPVVKALDKIEGRLASLAGDMSRLVRQGERKPAPVIQNTVNEPAKEAITDGKVRVGYDFAGNTTFADAEVYSLDGVVHIDMVLDEGIDLDQITNMMTVTRLCWVGEAANPGASINQ